MAGILGISCSMKNLLQKLFPRTAKYNRHWILENSLGENVLYNTEALAKGLEIKPHMKVLDLGCGKAASSIFLAKEYGCQVWAVDNTVTIEENRERVRSALVDSLVFPVQSDARELPFEKDFFDLVIAVDSYMYYGSKQSYLPYVMEFIKPEGKIAIIDACFRTEITNPESAPGYLRRSLTTFWRKMHSVAWWKKLWQSSGKVKILEAKVLRESDLILEEYIRDYKNRPEEQPVIDTLRRDRGRFFGIFRLIAQKLRTVEQT